MNVLFVHNNFPAQFRHVAQRLARGRDNLVAAIGAHSAPGLPHVLMRRYLMEAHDLSQTHVFARRLDLEARRAEKTFYSALSLKEAGFEPDVIVAHSGWGESLPLRAVFPHARLVVYCEFYYGSKGRDVDFDSEFPRMPLDGVVSLGIKNATQALSLLEADAGLSPTRWQRSTYPVELQDKIAVIHEGIDTKRVRPDPAARLIVPGGIALQAGEEILTYVARDLEPIRGYHAFMRALPEILRRRPNARALIVGGDGLSYGAAPAPGSTWKDIFLDEVRDELDMSRVHFLGRLPYDAYLKVLQISRAHVYLTFPFVLSWSLTEAMSAGCLIVAGDVPTTRELLCEDCGVLTPFSETAALIEAVTHALADPARHLDRRAQARARIVSEYDLDTVTLPATLKFLEDVASR